MFELVYVKSWWIQVLLGDFVKRSRLAVLFMGLYNIPSVVCLLLSFTTWIGLLCKVLYFRGGVKYLYQVIWRHKCIVWEYVCNNCKLKSENGCLDILAHCRELKSTTKCFYWTVEPKPIIEACSDASEFPLIEMTKIQK